MNDEEFTMDDFIEIRKLASKYFNSNRMMRSLTRDDFVAECAMAVVTYMSNKDKKFSEVPLTSVINYAFNNYVASSYNTEKAPRKAWKAVKHEAACDHELMSSFASQTSTDEVEYFILINSAHKVLSPKNKKIFTLLLAGDDPKIIAEKTGNTYISVIRAIKSIQKTLKDEDIV